MRYTVALGEGGGRGQGDLHPWLLKEVVKGDKLGEGVLHTSPH